MASFTFQITLSKAVIQIVDSYIKYLNKVWSVDVYRLPVGAMVVIGALTRKAFLVSTLGMGLVSTILIHLYQHPNNLICINLIAYWEKVGESALVCATYMA